MSSTTSPGAGLEAGARPRMDPRIARRRVEVRREEGRRRLRILFWCAVAAVVVSLLVGSLWTPIFKVRHVRVDLGTSSARPAAPGATPLSMQQVIAAAGLAKRPLMIDVDGAAVARRLDAVPSLGRARVSVDWPGTVSITVLERHPVAAIAAPQRQGTPARWAVVDATGRVLSVESAPVPGLPVVYGVSSLPGPGGWFAGTAGPSAPVTSTAGGSAGAAGTKPPASLADMNARSDSTDVPLGVAAALAIAAALPDAIRAEVQAVTLDPKSPASLSLTVVPAKMATGSIKVELGDGSQLAAKLTALDTLLNQADLAGVTAIDLSVPDRPAALTAR